MTDPLPRRVNATCEVKLARAGAPVCGKPTTHAYPAARVGWWAVCEQHAAALGPYCTPVAELADAKREA